MLKRTGIVRKRKNPFTKANRAARKRRQAATVSLKVRDEEARAVVMARAGAYLVDGTERTYYGKCERCGRMDFLAWCHLFTRGLHATRHEPDNAYAGCSSCHYVQSDARRDTNLLEDQPWTGKGVEPGQKACHRWWREKIGPERYERIRQMADGRLVES